MYNIQEINKLKPKDSRLTAVQFCEYIVYKNAKYRAVLANCECGGNIKTIASRVVLGRTKSCGCLSSEIKKSTIYSISTTGKYKGLYYSYTAMMSRCYNKNNAAYKYYGKKGVRVCKEWKNNYQNFLKWGLENGWKEKLQLDKDKLGNGKLYSPSTCCWLTATENSKYKSKASALIIEYNGENLTLGQICKLTGANHSLVYGRLKNNNNDIYKAINMGNAPIRGKNKIIKP